MQKFIIEYIGNGGQPHEPEHRLNEIEAETLEIVTTRVSNTIRATPHIEGAVIYTPRVELQAERRVNVAEITPTGSIPKAAGAVTLDRWNAPTPGKDGDGLA